MKEDHNAGMTIEGRSTRSSSTPRCPKQTSAAQQLLWSSGTEMSLVSNSVRGRAVRDERASPLTAGYLHVSRIVLSTPSYWRVELDDIWQLALPGGIARVVLVEQLDLASMPAAFDCAQHTITFAEARPRRRPPSWRVPRRGSGRRGHPYTH